MMADSKAVIFVRKICQRTLEGALDWEKTPSPATFQTVIGEHRILFIESSSPNGDIYVIQIRTSEGDTIDSYTDEMFDPPGQSAADGSFFKVMGDAYSAARRNAMGIEKALDDILSELD